LLLLDTKAHELGKIGLEEFSAPATCAGRKPCRIFGKLALGNA
jgi:hypothetical protein